MADTFYRAPQIPNLADGAPDSPDAGFLRIFGRVDRLYGKLPNGAEVNLTAPSIFDEGTGLVFSPSLIDFVGPGVTVASNGDQATVSVPSSISVLPGNTVPVAGDFPNQQSLVLAGLPARPYVLDDLGNVREIYNEDQSNFLYWKTTPGTPAGRQTVSQTAPANPQEGDIWFRVQ